MNKVDCCLSYDSFWAILKRDLHLITLQWVPCALLKAIVWAFLATKSFAACSSTYPCHMAYVSKSVPRDVISSSDCHPRRHRSAMDVARDSRGWSLSIPLTHSSGFLRLVLMISCQNEYPGWDTWSALGQTPQVRKEVLSWYYFCLWLPHRKRDVGASSSTRRVSWETRYLWTNINSGSCRCICRKLRV